MLNVASDVEAVSGVMIGVAAKIFPVTRPSRPMEHAIPTRRCGARVSLASVDHCRP